MFELVLIFVIYLFKVNESALSVGEYPDYRHMDINLAECGLNRVVRKVDTLVFNKKCFRYNHPNRTTVHFADEVDQVSNRIWSGNEVGWGEAPWVVHLYHDIYECTGVLITFEWVLTAGHCLDQLDSRRTDMYVYAGNTQRERGEKRKVNKDKLFIHTEYNRSDSDPINFVNDIGLAKLEEKFPRHLSDGSVYLINPICLPGVYQYLEEEPYFQRATFYGFGMVNKDQGLPAKLQKGEALVYSCLEDRGFCAIYNPDSNVARTCEGDSGGPLVQFGDYNRAVLLGVLSGGFGSSDCGKSSRDIWVKVSQKIDWILNITSTTNGSATPSTSGVAFWHEPRPPPLPAPDLKYNFL